MGIRIRKPLKLSIKTTRRSVMAGNTSCGEKYSVFLSFRGPDTRDGFVDCLYVFLREAGVRVFMDDEELRIGETIGTKIKEAIYNSKLFVPVFSRGYALSKWCLREIAWMADCMEAYPEKEMIPIFYDVDPSVVKLKTDLYERALLEHENNFGRKTVARWRKALIKVPKLKGWKLANVNGQGKLIERIAKDISRKLEVKKRYLPNHLIGIAFQVKAVMNLLDCGSTDKRIVVIHGMGGIGKTTLAEVVFNRIYSDFQGYSFLSSVRESVVRNGIVYLQNQLLRDLFKFSSASFHDSSEAMNTIRSVLRNKRVLIVLDDVNDMDQIMKLIGMGDWIGDGSRVIITTRNLSSVANIEQIENNAAFFQSKRVYTYKMGELIFNDALELLSWHAFGQCKPPTGYEQLSNEILGFTRGVPLAIQVTGSSLWGKESAIWNDMIKKFRKVPPDRLYQEILMSSYVNLSEEEKEIFLDIAFYFAGQSKTNSIYYWEACDLFPAVSIDALVSYALVEIDYYDRFWMHDLLKNLGRQVVRKQNIDHPGRRSRLCDEDAKRVLSKIQGTEDVKAMKLDSSHAHNFAPAELSGLTGLRFLDFSGGNFIGEFDAHLSELRWLSWHDCPLDFGGNNFCLDNLVVLRLSGSSVTEAWGAWDQFKTAKNLKVLELEGLNLTMTPDFSSFSSLERLVVKDCRSLVHIDTSVNNLQCLNSLEVNWYNGPSLPDDVNVPVEILREMYFGNPESCYEAFQMPSSICNFKALSRLEITGVTIEQLPVDIGQLKGLTILELKHCNIVQDLPDSIGELESLTDLSLKDAGIAAIPESIGGLKNLIFLDVSHNQIRRLPASIITLENLIFLYASGNEHLKSIPRRIGKLRSLTFLDLSRTAIRRLPKSVRSLGRLIHLCLMSCNEMQSLPQLPRSLKNFTITSRSLKEIPDLSTQTDIISLCLSNVEGCEGHLYHPESLSGNLSWIRNMHKMEKLKLLLAPTLPLSTELESIPQLQHFLLFCPDPSFLSPPSHLQTFPMSETMVMGINLRPFMDALSLMPN